MVTPCDGPEQMQPLPERTERLAFVRQPRDHAVPVEPEQHPGFDQPQAAALPGGIDQMRTDRLLTVLFTSTPLLLLNASSAMTITFWNAAVFHRRWAGMVNMALPPWKA